MENNGNIILNQIFPDGSSFKIKETFPLYAYSDAPQTLIKHGDASIYWASIDLSLNIIVNNKLVDTDIYYDNGRVGIGRFPLFNYKIDVQMPKDTLMTAFHIGDGSFGFSMGNGTNKGFVPEIIGIGSDENDTGLYLVGVAGNDVSSNIPLIILDGRNAFGERLINRPILGVTSGNYNEYLMLLDSSENLNVKNNIITSNIIVNGLSLLKIIADLQEQINELQTKIT